MICASPILRTTWVEPATKALRSGKVTRMFIHPPVFSSRMLSRVMPHTTNAVPAPTAGVSCSPSTATAISDEKSGVVARSGAVTATPTFSTLR